MKIYKDKDYIPKAVGELDSILNGERAECTNEYMSTRDHDKIEKQFLKCEGYSLLELSLVIAIIGFLSGIIVTFGNLTKNSKVVSVIKELQSFKSSYVTFYNIYGSWPGDMSNATILFGSSDKNGNSVYNGNGDGLIGNGNSSLDVNQEQVSAFQHLSLAGLIMGQYNGVLSKITSGTVNYPYTIYGKKTLYYNNSSNLWSNFTYMNSLQICSSSALLCYNTPLVAVADAYNIDLKIDDGLPLKGMIVSYDIGTNCATSNISSSPNLNTTLYKSSNTGAYCNVNMSLESYGFY